MSHQAPADPVKRDSQNQFLLRHLVQIGVSLPAGRSTSAAVNTITSVMATEV